MTNNHSYEDNRSLELKIAPLIKEKIYNVLYPKCTFDDNRDKNSISNKTENFLKSSKFIDEDIKQFLDTRLAIDITVTPTHRIPMTFQEKVIRYKSWSNMLYWTENLPKIKIRYERKITFNDGNVKIYKSEYFKICADNYLIAFLDVNGNIQEWIMLDVSIMKHIIDRTINLRSELKGELVDDDLKNPNIPNATSFCSFPIYHLRDAVIDGSKMFKHLVWLKQYKKDDISF